MMRKVQDFYPSTKEASDSHYTIEAAPNRTVPAPWPNGTHVCFSRPEGGEGTVRLWVVKGRCSLKVARIVEDNNRVTITSPQEYLLEKDQIIELSPDEIFVVTTLEHSVVLHTNARNLPGMLVDKKVFASPS